MAEGFPNYQYDVFLSFRGEDTYYGFTGNLYGALRTKGIKVFFDDESLKGDEIISPGEDGNIFLEQFLKVIEESRIFIIVFSRNYKASPGECLRVLEKSLECKKKNNQYIIPIFYEVDLSDMRHMRNSCGNKALRTRKIMFSENSIEESTWKYVLTEVGELEGYHFRSYEHEVELIQKIVEDVSKRLPPRKPGDNSGSETSNLYHLWAESILRKSTRLIGIDKRCKHIELLLEDSPVVGIWGMTGIGKTTIAKVVFAKLFTLFERCCFFENVREVFMKHGLHYLQGKLLYELFKEENLHINGPIVEGCTQLFRNLQSRKVLIVLDDVGDSYQLEYLIKKCTHFGARSRVIITTRDKNLLANLKVNEIYEVDVLNFEEALQLYNLHAFRQNSSEIEHEELSKKMVNYCQGIPLTLKVLGSFFRYDIIGERESVLAELKMNDIQDVLRLGFDLLDSDYKEIFVYIACFLKGEYIHNVLCILRGCGYQAIFGMAALIVRALVTISYDGKVQMHHMIQEMGQEILREICLAESQRRGHPEDIHDLSNENWKTLAVEGLPLDVSQIEGLHRTANAFKRMSTLRMLADSYWAQRLPKVYRPLDLSFLLGSPPSILHPENPDLSEVSSNVASSDDDMEEDEPEQRDAPNDTDTFGFGSSSRTMKVTLESKLKELPENLHTHRVEGCQLLESLPGELRGKTSSVSNLHAIDCPYLKNLVDGRNFTSLRTLYTLNCRKLNFSLPSANFARLEHLCVGSSCDTLEDFTLNRFPKLRTLCIWDFPKLQTFSIFEEFGQDDLPLESLEIRDCPRLVSFPTEGLPVTKLLSLTLSSCIALKSLPNGKTLKYLRTIFIDRCPELHSLPDWPLLPRLSLLSISFCDNLIPKKEWGLNRLHSLTRFEIEGAGEDLKSFPEEDLLPTSLNSLRISNLSSLVDLDHGLHQLTALQSLDINCCQKLSSFLDEKLPSSLVSLSIQESPLLTRDLKLQSGANWLKIAHVPNIRIDGDLIPTKIEEK